MRWDNNRPPPTIKDFDNKVSEADAYLQLMIEQTKVSTYIRFYSTCVYIKKKQYCVILWFYLSQFYCRIKVVRFGKIYILNCGLCTRRLHRD